MKVGDKMKKTYNFIACNNCHDTNTTLIKAIDSYYCKDCFKLLKKKKYIKSKKENK